MRHHAIPTTPAIWPRLALLLALLLAIAARPAQAAEIRLAEQFSMGYLQFNVMKRDKLIEKYAAAHGVPDVKVTWMRFNGPSSMNEALLSNSTDIVTGGVPGLITLWDKTRGSSDEVRGICALSTQPFLLNTNKPGIKTIADFTDADRIALPAVRVSVQAVVLQMAAAKAFGAANYGKLDHLTISMTPPDSTIALMTNSAPITAVFSVPPFQSQQLTAPGVHTVLSSFDVMGPHTFTVAWTTARFRRENPALYAAFLDAVKEATQTVNDHPRETAETWIKDTGSKQSVDTVAAIVNGSGVKWTMVPENNATFANFMHQSGLTKHEAASWKDLYFPDIADLPGN